MFLADYKLLLKRLGLALIFIVASRLGFYFYNFEYFQAADLADTFLAFFLGLRFDLATVLIANLAFTLLSIFPFSFAGKEKLLRALFVLVNTVCLGFIIGDYEFFGFNGKKLTYDLFLMGGDVEEQSLQLIFNYWYLSSLVPLGAVALWKLYPSRPDKAKRESKAQRKKLSLGKALGLSLAVFLATAIGIRGGLQMRSLSPKQAFVFQDYELGNFALNSAYSLVRSFGKRGAPPARHFSSDKEAFEVVLDSRNFKQSEWGRPGQNVVVIIVESLSQEYIERGFAPFVSDLAEQGLYFPYNFANGRRSIEVLPSIMAGFPSVAGAPLYKSQYQSNKFHPLPRILKENGYATAFYHGGKRGTMDFDAYCFSIGFEEYHALEDYPEDNHYDGHWGVYDHHYLGHFADKLDDYDKPFFASLFTLSSHQPYSIPKEFQNTFPKGDLPIHESIGYADRALKMFFDKAKKKSWFEDTLFVITADHTQKLSDKRYHTVLGRYRTPLIFYHPRLDLPASSGLRITQHADIMPSILDFLNISYEPRLYFGASVFNDDPGRMFNYISNNHFLLKGRSLVSFDGKQARFYRVGENYLSLDPAQEARPELLKELKALIQYTNNGLRSNNIYDLSR